MHPKYWKQSLNHVFRKPAEEGESGGGALDMNTAADAFGSLFGDDQNENEAPESAATDEATEVVAEEAATEEAATEEASDAPEAADTITVEIDGKTVTLTKEQIAENHKNGLRQADYTRKTMEAAEARKSAEAEATKARTERNEYAQKLNHFAIAAESQIAEQRAQLTQELLDSDPVGYLTLERTVQARQAQLAQAQQEMSRLNEQQQQEQQQAEADHIRSQQEQLLAKVPEWKDAAKLTAEVAELKAYLGTQDFAENERVFPDHRLVILARKAMKYDASVEKAKAAVQKVAKLPTKVERPGTPVPTNDRKTEAMKRLGKTGSIDDAANAFASLG